MIGNNSRNNTRRRSFQRIREDVHSPFLIKGNYYNGEREVEETKILIDTGASCNHIQADQCEIIGSITNPYVYKNYDGQTVRPRIPGCLVDNPSTCGIPVSHIMRPIHE